MTLDTSLREMKAIHHVELLVDAGLVARIHKQTFRLTNSGHDYIEAIRNDTSWAKIKDGAAKAGGATLEMMKDLAIAYLKQEASQKLGIQL